MRACYRMVPVLALVAWVGCDDGPVEPDRTPTPDASSILAMLGSAPMPPDTTGRFEINQTMDCPAGGSRTMELVIEMSNGPEPGVYRSTSSGVHTLTDCATSANGIVRTTSGSMAIESEALFRMPEGGGVADILFLSSHSSGTITYSGTDTETLTCTMDLTRSVDYRTRKARVVGTFCGEYVDQEVEIPER